MFNFENKTITWQELSISVKPTYCTTKEFFIIKESRPVRNITKRIKQILYVEYIKLNLKSIVMNLNYIKYKHKNFLLELLQKCEEIFDATLGKHTVYNYTIEVKEDAKPYHTKPFPIGVSKKINNSQWTVPIFIISKKNGTVILKSKPFRYATSLDLTMGYYHITVFISCISKTIQNSITVRQICQWDYVIVLTFPRKNE